MLRLIGLFLVVAIAAAAYFLTTEDSMFAPKQQPKVLQKPAVEPPVASKVTPVKQSVVKKVTQPVVTKAEKQQAQAHVDSITTQAAIPLEITSADHFVTADQILLLPALNAPEVAEIISTENSPALLVSAPAKQTAKLNDIDKNAENAAAAQSFAIKIPTFKKPQQNNDASSQLLLAANTVTVIKAEASITASPATVAQNSSDVDNIKILGTVTGTVEKKAVTATSSPKLQITDNLQKTNHSIIDVIKKNLEQLSDIKVSELTELVTAKITGESSTVAADAVTVEKTAATNVSATAPSTLPATNKNTTAAVSSEVIVVKAKNIVQSKKITLSDKNRIQLRELLTETQSDKKRIFYLHAVNVKDDQGIWGIIQHGLIGTFSKGIALSQAEGEVTALIPQDADEMLLSKRSSFLGKLLNNKVLTTYVYNFEQGNIGKNPDVIRPGQQLIIVTFTEEELMSVYLHFKNHD